MAPVLAAALGAAACNDGLTDINTNPNQPTTAPAPYVLTDAEIGSVGTILGTGFHMTLTALWSQQFAKIQYIDEDRYDLRPATVDAFWSGLYSGPLRDFAEVSRQGTEQGHPNYTAIGNIMSVWTFHAMTDVWGDIPYTQALQGAVVDGGNVTPEYDTQQAIYTDMIARLATASGQLSAGGGDFGSADVINDGDPDLWRRFSNSLRLRLAMRMSLRSPVAARAAFEAAAAQPLILTNAQNADLEYGEESGSANPIYKNRYEGGRLDHAVSKTMVDALKAWDDPRLGIYADPAGEFSDEIAALPDGAPIPEAYYNGQPNGITAAAANVPTISLIGQYFYQPTTPAVLMSASEVYFLLAEARLRGWTLPGSFGTAQQLYDLGVTRSMQEYGIAQADIDTYLAQGAATLTGTADQQIAQVAMQKWIALYNNGPEAYAEWRRLGVPSLAVVPGTVNGPRIPVRVFYPTIEQSLNNANLQVAVGRQGGMTLNDKVWWDL
jgi:hypothetical protein